MTNPLDDARRAAPKDAVFGWAIENSRPRADGKHEVWVSIAEPRPNPRPSAPSIGRAAAALVGIGLALPALLVAAGLSWVAGRYSRATSAPSAQPSTRAEREVRKAIRRGFIAAGLGDDLPSWRADVKRADRTVADLRQRLAVERDPMWRRHRERQLCAARGVARRSQLRYAAACAAAGAVPRGAR